MLVGELLTVAVVKVDKEVETPPWKPFPNVVVEVVKYDEVVVLHHDIRALPVITF
jgi:hypothetical protein